MGGHHRTLLLRKKISLARTNAHKMDTQQEQDKVDKHQDKIT